MRSAAESLGVAGLRDLCDRRLGEFVSRVRTEWITLAEVRERNAGGETLLTMDGMVLDVTRWLDEHPGGSTIIPEQALNVDSTVFFELYHSSRQSFGYLREFYIGELRREDCEVLPAASKGTPSEGFLGSLREYTRWRVVPEERVHKSL